MSEKLGEEDIPTQLRGSGSTGLVLRVVAAGTVLAFPIPRKELVTVGRGVGVDIRVPMPDMSRRQIILSWENGLTVTDLGSSNGTILRGKKLTPADPAPLTLRELFFVADAALMVQEGLVTDGPKRHSTPEAFEAALQEHLDSYARTKSPFGICSIDVASDGAWIDLVTALLAKTDVIGILSETSVRVLLVDRTPEQLEVVADFLQRALMEFSASRRVILRVCPRDGTSRPSLYNPAYSKPRGVEVKDTRRPPAPLVQSAAMLKIYALIDEVAHTTTSILLLGETGVGKDVVAKAIHSRSDRAAAPMVGLNCAALPESLLESELFGYERGAFTGAVSAKPGLIESAEGGTVFLDEVGEMPLPTQAKLLRVLEERKVLRVGGLKPKAVDFRLLSATNRNLRAEIASGRFRADLFYRINGLSISLPPLRQRADEIVPLAQHFATRAAQTLGRPVPIFAAETLRCLERYEWPGNIRELRSVIERAVLLARAGSVLVEHLPEEIVEMPSQSPATLPAEMPTATSLPSLDSSEDDDEPPEQLPSSHHVRTAVPPPAAPGRAPATNLREELEVLEQERILATLKEFGGNQTRAAQALGMTRRALIIRLERYGVPRPRRAKAE
jgi:transcriptional regulator with GAF, ATPase, and Fis domain